MLRKKAKEWVRFQKMMDRKQKPADRQRLHRIRKAASKAFEDLTFLAENLPEREYKRIFSAANVKPLLHALLTLRTKTGNGEEKWLEGKELENKRKQVLELWSEILGNILSNDYMDKIIVAESKDVRDFIHGVTSGKGELLKAFLWIATMKE